MAQKDHLSGFPCGRQAARQNAPWVLLVELWAHLGTCRSKCAWGDTKISQMGGKMANNRYGEAVGLNDGRWLASQTENSRPDEGGGR